MKSNTWANGADLPLKLYRAAIIPFETTFIIIGGVDHSNDGYSNKVYRYTSEGTWEELSNMELLEGRSHATAMIVPSELFD